ncbi:MAG: hypothetical protein EA378_11880 [Phycisphaerales bacterium]|nr:MAG: hypothetical protein EA378_11880 [Phycisphaerales bacterium]
MLGVIALAGVADAQNRDASQPRRAPEIAPASGASLLADSPAQIEAVGLRFYPPADARTNITRLGDQTTVQVLPEGSTWVMNVQTPRTRDGEQTVRSVSEAILNQLLESVAAVEVRGEEGAMTARANVIRVPDLEINNQPAARFYVALGDGDRANAGERVIRGYTVFKPMADRFVTFELITTEAEFARARPIYELVVGTALFSDVGERAEAQQASAERSGAFIEALSGESMRRAIGVTRERWDRLYEPSASGSDRDATEIGYRRLRTRTGQRGELRPEVPQSRWRAADRERGYIVHVDSRVLQDRQVIDIESIFFMGENRESEAWTIRVAVRDRQADRRQSQVAFTEIGAREGSRLSVQVEPRGGAPTASSANIDPRSYVSQVEHFLLPHLLVQGGGEGSYAFTYWSSNAGAVTTRRDELREPSSGVFELESTLVENDPAQTSRFNEEGRLLRTTLPATDMTPRRVWQPIELNRLMELWRSKGLPMN